MVVLENSPWRPQDLSMMKTAPDLKSNGKNTEYTRGCRGKVAGFFFPLTVIQVLDGT